jgi:hypothetical protein
MRSQKALALAAALALLLTTRAAHAEPVSWSYSWSSSPGVVNSDDGSLGSVSFLPGSGGPQLGSVNSGPGIQAASLVATAPASGLATFTNQGYGLTLSLTDNASHATGSLTFGGALSGTLGRTNDVTNTFSGATTKSINLGGNEYTVGLGLFVPPLPGTPGSLGANVTVVPGPGSSPSPPANDVPEPTSLVLAGLGLSALGLNCWRRRRQAQAVPGPA